MKDRRRFKYRYQSRVYFLVLPKGRLSHTAEEDIRRIIEADIRDGIHDNTQEKYKRMLIPGDGKSAVKEGVANMLKDYLTKTGRGMDKDLYFNTHRMVENWGKDISIDMIPQLLETMKYSSHTFNDRKGVLKKFCDWLIINGKLGINPLHDTPSKRNGSSKDPRRKRLTDEEIRLILEAIYNDTFVHKHSHRFKHSTYYPIFCFLAYTGVRPAEAIGLQVKKVDLKKCIILIDQALARTREGTSAGNRVMKGTKMEDSRELPYKKSSAITKILIQQCEGKGPDDLVFTSPMGVACDDRAMNDSVLKVVCRGLKIDERVLYVFRHSFATRCFEKKMDIKTVQSLTGHRDVTVLLKIYAEVSRKKAVLPEF